MKDFDVVILGAGSGGMGSAYALKNLIIKGVINRLRIAIVDRNAILGGTATAGWVTTWLQAMIPPHMEEIICTINGLNAEDQRKYWLRGDFAKDNVGNISIGIDGTKLSQQYEQDIKDYVQIYLGYTLKSVESFKSGVIESVCIENKLGECEYLSAIYWIDATGDGVLCRLCDAVENQDYYCGRDPQSRFNESIAQVSGNFKQINEASMMYEIAEGVDDSEILDRITSVNAVYDENGKVSAIVAQPYISGDGYGSCIINPMTGQSNSPYQELIGKNYDDAHSAYTKYMLEHWKFIKLSCQQAFEKGESKYRAYSVSLRNFGYTGNHAPFLGIRETYRIVCEDMMTQNDMTLLITEETVEKYGFVGESSHIVDFHLSAGLTGIDDLNKQELRPHGIKYKALIPKKLKNVLVASRCYGASQIFLAGARGNFTMAYLGYSVGTAIGICLLDGLDDVRNIDVPKLQMLSDFTKRVKILQTLYKDNL